MALSDAACRTAKGREGEYKLSDGGGLYLFVKPNGARVWQQAYRFAGKQKKLTHGPYPLISLADARRLRDEAKRLLASGVDPGANKRANKAAVAASVAAATSTFGVIATEFIDKMTKEGRAQATLLKAHWLLEEIALPLRNRPIAEITPPEILAVLRAVEVKGHYETARRSRSIIGQVFRYAIATSRAERDVTADLRGALIAPTTKHRAAITRPKRLGELMAAIYGWTKGQETTVAGLKLLSLLALRPGELRAATWDEIDLEARVWTVPASRTKMRRPHCTPLPLQAVATLQALRDTTRSRISTFVFPATVSVRKPMSENTLNFALRRLDIGAEEMTAHGFRAAFATLANESRRWHPDAIERQLAHVEGNNVRRAYTRGEHWDERVLMMQWWADELDRLRETAIAEARNAVPPQRRPAKLQSARQ